MAKQLNVNLAFTADTSQAQRNLTDLQKTLNNIANTSPLEGMNLSKSMQEAVSSAKELQQHINNAFNVKTGNLDLNKLNASLQNAGTDLNTLSANLLKAGSTGEQAFMNIQRAISTASVQINQANGLLTQFWTTLKNTARWQISSSILHGFMGALQSAWGYAKDLDESLNNIRIVTGYGTEQMAQFAEQANRAAKALNTTTTSYTNASLIYYQQGLSNEEVLERTNVTVKMANVAGKSAEEVSDQLTAVWNNFYDGSKSLEYYADVMTALGAATASSTDEIAEGLEKFAAVAETVGLSYEYATAALATVTAETRQSADVVGTAFKTLFARLQDLELGETLDDGTTLGKYSAALDAVGINIKNTNGELKDMDQILDELGNKWTDLSKDTQVALAQTVAGTRQYTQLVALMDNWDVFQENLGTAKNSKGALQEQADIYAESWEAATAKVRASAEGIYDKLFPVREMTKMAEGFAAILEGVGGLISGLGGLKGILLLISTIVLNAFQSQIGNAIQSGIEKVQKFTFSFNGIKEATKSSVSSVSDINRHLKEVSSHTKTANEQADYFAQNLAEGANQATIEAQNLVKTAMAQENISQSLTAYETNLSKIHNIQALIEKSGRHLTNEQKQQLSLQQQQLITLNEQHQRELEKLEALQRERSLLMNSVGDEGQDADNWEYDDSDNLGYVSNVVAAEGAPQSIQNFLTAYNTGLADTELKINNIGNVIQQHGTHIKVNIEDMNKFNAASQGALQGYGDIVALNERLRGIVENTTISEEEKRKKINEIVEATSKESGILGYIGRQYKKNSKDVTQLSKTMKKAESDASRYASAMGASGKQLQNVKKNSQEIAAQQGKIAQGAAHINNGFQGLVDTLSKGINQVNNFGNSLVRVAQGVSSVAMGISSIKSAVDTFGDAEASWVEKLSAGAMAAVMGLQALMTVMKGVQAVTLALNTAQTVNNALNTTSLALSGAITAAESQEALALVAKEAATHKLTQAEIQEMIVQSTGMATDKAAALATLFKAGADKTGAEALKGKSAEQVISTVTTNAGTVANIAYAASQWLVCWPLLIIVAVIAAIVAITVALINARKKEIEANKNLAESSRKAADAYKAEADANKELIDSYKEALKTYRETGEGKEEVIQSAIKAAQAYGIEGAAVDALAGNYDALAKKLDKARKKELEGQRDKQKTAIKTTNTAMSDALREGDGRKTASGRYVGQFDNGLSNSDEQLAYRALNEGEYKYLSRSGGEVRFEVADITDPYAMYAYYNELQQYATAQEQLAAETGQNLGKSEIYNDVLAELKEGSEQYEQLKQYIEEMRKTEMEWASLDAMERVEDGSVDTIAEYLKFEEDYLSQYKKVLESQGVKEGTEEYKKLIDEARVYVASLDADIAKLQAEAKGFDDLTTEKNKVEMDKIKAFYEGLSSEEQQLFWTMGIDEDTSLQYVQDYMQSTQAYLNANKLFATIGLKDEIIAAYEAGDYKLLKEKYEADDSPYKDKLSWQEFLALDPKEAEAFLNNYELEFDKMQTVLNTALENNAKNIEKHSNEVAEAEKKLADTINGAENDIQDAKDFITAFTTNTGFHHVGSGLGNEMEGRSYDILYDDKYKSTNWQDAEVFHSYKFLSELQNTLGQYDIENTPYANMLQRYLTLAGQVENDEDVIFNSDFKSELKGIAVDLYDVLKTTDAFKYYEINGRSEDGIETIYHQLFGELEKGTTGLDASQNVDKEGFGWHSKEVAGYFLDSIYGTLENEIPRITEIWQQNIDNASNEVDIKTGALEEAEGANREDILLKTQQVKRARLEALQQLSDNYNLDFEELEAFQELLIQNNEELESNIGLLNNITLATFRLRQGIKEGYDNWSDWNDILIESDATLEEVAAIIPEVKNVLGNLFNLDAAAMSLLPADFIQKNWNILSQALQGSQEAYDQMQVLIASTLGEYSNLSQELLLAIAQDTTMITGEFIRYNKDGVAKYLQKLINQLFVDALRMGKSVNEIEQYVNQVFESLGYSVTWVRDEVTGDISGWSGFTRLANDELSNWNNIIELEEKDRKISRKKLDEVIERYYEINNAIDDVTDSLDDANRELDKMYGNARLKQMGKVNNLLKEEIKLLEKKQQENANWLEYDRRAMETALNNSEYNSNGLEFIYDNNGNITNYNEVMQYFWDKLENMYDTADAYTDAEKQDEYINDTLKPYEEWLMGFLEKVTQYDETKEMGEDITNEIADNWAEWQSKNAEALTLKMELELSIDDRELEWLEYQLSKIEDDAFSMAEALGLMVGTLSENGELVGGQLQSYLSSLESVQEAFGMAEHLHTTIDPESITEENPEGYTYINDADYYEQLETITAELYENLQALNELDKAMMHYYADTLAAMGEELDKVTEKMENQSKVLDHYKSLMSAFGKETDYKSIGIILEGQSKLLADQTAAAKATWTMYQEQVTKTYDRWQAEVKANGEDSEAAKLYEKEYEAALDAAEGAQDAYLAKAAEWAESLKAILENTLADLNKSLEKTLTGGTTFDALNQSMERAKSLQEEYLTATNKVYETNKLMRTAQQEIDKTTNTAAKKRLQAYIKETQQLQNKSELSQYELEIQQAKYDLVLAEIALEEAQNAKSTVRLRRDSEGNLGYVYTADANAIADAQQKLEDAQNSLYNIGLEGAADYAEKYQQQMQEMYDDFIAIEQQRLEGAFASEEEYHAAMEEAKKYHYDKLSQFSELYQIALSADSNVAADTWTNDTRWMINQSEDWKTDVTGYVEDVSGAFKQWQKDIDTINEEIGLDDLATKVESVVTQSENLLNILTGKDGEQGLIDRLGAEATAVLNLTGQYAQLKKDIESAKTQYEAFLTLLKNRQNEASGGGNSNIDGYAYQNPDGSWSGHYDTAQAAAEAAWAKYGKNDIAIGSIDVQTDAAGNVTKSYSRLTESSTVGDYTFDRSTYQPYEPPEGNPPGGETCPTCGKPLSECKCSNEEETIYRAEIDSSEAAKALASKLGLTDEQYAALATAVGSGTSGGYESAADAQKAAIDFFGRYLNDIGKLDLTSGNLKSLIKIVGSDGTTSWPYGVPPVTTIVGNKKLSAYAYEYNHKLYGPHTSAKSAANDAHANGVPDTAFVLGVVYDASKGLNGGPTATTPIDTVGNLRDKKSSSTNSYVGSNYNGGHKLPNFNFEAVPFDTGGYTGSWAGSYGKLAMLHQKELILNPSDTENFLASMNVLERILQVLDLQAVSSQLGGLLTSPGFTGGGGTLEQNVHIEASFPNATNHSEIEEAFSNLVNLASQYANRK